MRTCESEKSERWSEDGTTTVLDSRDTAWPWRLDSLSAGEVWTVGSWVGYPVAVTGVLTHNGVRWGVRSSVFGARALVRCRLFPYGVARRNSYPAWPGSALGRATGGGPVLRGRSRDVARAGSLLVISTSQFYHLHNYQLSHTCVMQGTLQAAATDFAPKCSERRGERGGALLNSAVGGVV